MVCDVPDVACNLMAEPILPSADINTPPADASKLMAAAPVPSKFTSSMVCDVPDLACNLIALAISPSADINTPPTSELTLIDSAVASVELRIAT